MPGIRKLQVSRDRIHKLLLIGAVILWQGALVKAAQKAITVVPSASYAHRNDGHKGDPLPALCDGSKPSSSDDRRIPRFTFWSHKGSTEWVQYEFDAPAKVASAQVYWFDDRPGGGCRVPRSWRLLYQSGYEWRPVREPTSYDVLPDEFNEVKFEPVVTTALRLEVQHQPDASGGILEWKINGQSPRLNAGSKQSTKRYADLNFNYPRTRLALFAQLQASGGSNAEAKQALASLDELASNIDSVRELADDGDTAAIDRLKQLGARLAKFQSQNDAKAILDQVHEADPSAGQKLMTQWDWVLQDSGGASTSGFQSLAKVAIGQLGASDAQLAARNNKLIAEKAVESDSRWMDLYLDACEARRGIRLAPHLDKLRRVVFTKHHDIGGQHYAYTEDVSDSPYNDNNPFPSSGKLCLIEMDGIYGHVRTLLDEPLGLIRDPAVSYDGQRILFARRESMDEDDYHLYEMSIADEKIRQLTSGQGVADYEATYLPSGDILFNSSRCQQIVDCWWADVSNLYTCDGDGNYLRRISFDQVHTNYPTVLPDGRVIYTRWDYNDRGQLFPQPLFQMNADGTGQKEFYGNNSWFPTSILHARGIPGSNRIVCVLSGHHTYQKGKLAIIDPGQGRQEASGVQLIAPVRYTEAVKIDKYGYQGEQFQYPYALSETEFLVTYTSKGSKKGRDRAEEPFGIYYMMIDGQRELLAADPNISCNQSVPLISRPVPPVHTSQVDYREHTGTYVVHDVYQGPGLHGIERGTVKRLRVVALEFRAAGVGSNGNRGPAGGALVSTPISVNGAWDVKKVLGSATVYEDGSTAFTVPARTPVYFQALDDRNQVVQTMRSWSTLQPGETFSCVGCHADKSRTPPASASLTQAMKAGPQSLEPLYDKPHGFSFPRLVQPILDRHCVECHDRKAVADKTSTISLEGIGTLDKRSLKSWSDAYLALASPDVASWVSPQSAPPILAPYDSGSANSKLTKMLAEGHEGVKLTDKEMDLISCWIDLGVPFAGTYTESMSEEHIKTYQRYADKRKHWAAEEARQIEALIRTRNAPKDR
ncbi:MAG: hypothetical protein GY903_25555 [Fuerstiella sp.]|nr:hypothetical protein [Fuerstiella sp.]MCP4857864.1 hypothetical protein [Fuerstiella sp.]